MERNEFSWQGVGMSSRPEIARDPISLHMLGYMIHGSENSERHLVVVGDSLQKHNYQALGGMGEGKALRVARRKGKRKARDLRILTKVHGLGNVDVVRWSDVEKKARDLRDDVQEVFMSDDEIRKRVIETIPSRFLEGFGREGVDGLANYTLDEVTLALHFGGVRVSHPKQERVDGLTLRVHEKHGLGNAIEFDYPDLGLEYEPKSGLMIEPYSFLNPEARVLAADDRPDFFGKIDGLSNKQRRRVIGQLERVWNGAVDNLGEFYESVVGPGHWRLFGRREFAREMTNTALGVTFILSLASLGGEKRLERMDTDYVNMPYKEFVMKYDRQLPPNFQGCFNMVYGQRYPDPERLSQSESE
jgi:hypothetical protein